MTQLSRSGFLNRCLLGCAVAFAVSPAGIAAVDLQVSSSYDLPRLYPPGGSLTLSIFSVQPPSATYEWFHDGVLIPAANSPSLSLANLSNSDSGNYLVRVTTDGHVEESDIETINVVALPSSPVDTTFKADLTPTSVYSIGPFASDGSVVITTVTGETQWGAVRLNATGARAAAFNFPSSGGRILAGFPNGDLIATQSPFRFNSDGSATTFSLPTPFDSAKPLTAAVALPNGKFLLAQATRVARFNADGSVDPTFTYSAEANGVTQTQALQVDDEGRIYVSALRQNPVPTNFPTSWTVIFRLTANGEKDKGFAEQVSEPILNGALQITPLTNHRLLYYAAYHGYRTWKLLRDDGSSDPAWSGTTTFSERALLVDRATDNVYLVDTSGKLLRYKITSTGLTLDEAFYSGFTSFLYVGPVTGRDTLAIDSQGRLLVAGNFESWDGFSTKGAARLMLSDPVPPPALIATINAPASFPPKGSTFTLSASVTGPGPFLYTWRALDGQPLPANSISDKLEIPNFSDVNLGRYQLRVTRSDGVSVLSNIVTLRLSPQLPYLSNLSGRAMTGSGEDTVIAGLVTKISAGALGLPTLIRGAGPALKPLGVSNFLPNPAIDVINSSGVIVANNDQWSVDMNVERAGNSAGAFPLTPGSNDAALLRTFATGTATIMLKNQGQGDGIGLLEIYQLFPTGSEYTFQSLMNLSFRAKTGAGDNVAIAGFVIVDPQSFGRSARVLLRAIGPTLSSQGIVHPLENPILTVYDHKGEVVAQNDDWGLNTTTARRDELASTMKQVGAFELPSASRDAALLLDLPAGAYSMHATGGTGVVLLEIYLVR